MRTRSTGRGSPSTRLEIADRVVVLVLDPRLRADELVERGVAVERGRDQVRSDPLACGEDVVEGRRLEGHEQTLTDPSLGDTAGARHNAQWRKWRRPVKTIVAPACSAAAITSSSRFEPPGWMIAV